MAETTKKTTAIKAATKAPVASAKPAAKKPAAKALVASAKPAAKKPVAKPTAVSATPVAKKVAAPKKPAVDKVNAANPAAKTLNKGMVVSDEQRYRMIAEAAYYRAESNQFKSDSVRDWIAAESDIATLLSGSK